MDNAGLAFGQLLLHASALLKRNDEWVGDESALLLRILRQSVSAGLVTAEEGKVRLYYSVQAGRAVLPNRVILEDYRGRCLVTVPSVLAAEWW